MANKKTSLTGKIVIAGIICAVAFVIFSAALKLDAKVMLSGVVVIWAIMIMVRMHAINGRNKDYSKMLEHLNKILTEDNDPEKYVQKCKDYANEVDDANFKAMLMVNESVGYSVMCKYEEAIEVLKNTDLSKLNPGHKAVALNNLAQFSYFLGKNEEGTKYVEDNFQMFQKYLSNKSFAASFMTTFTFYYYLRGNKAKAKSFTEQVIEFIKNSGSTSEGDMAVVDKMKDLLVKIEAMPDPEELYGDDSDDENEEN